MRGRGNMEPNRLGKRGVAVKLVEFWERRQDTCTTVKEQHVCGGESSLKMYLIRRVEVWVCLR